MPGSFQFDNPQLAELLRDPPAASRSSTRGRGGEQPGARLDEDHHRRSQRAVAVEVLRLCVLGQMNYWVKKADAAEEYVYGLSGDHGVECGSHLAVRPPDHKSERIYRVIGRNVTKGYWSLATVAARYRSAIGLVNRLAALQQETPATARATGAVGKCRNPLGFRILSGLTTKTLHKLRKV